MLFSQNALAASQADLDRLKDPAYIRSVKKPFYPSMSGEWLRGMVGAALEEVAGGLNRMGRGIDGGVDGGGGGERGGVFEVEHVGEWLREGISRAVVRALYGRRNPITLGRLYDIWCVCPPVAWVWW